MPATKKKTDWDIEMDYFRCKTKRYPYRGTVKGKRVQRKRANGEWTDWLYHHQMVDARLEADTKPHLREAAEVYNRAAGRMINASRQQRAVHERDRLLRARRRRKARERFAEICRHEWGHLYQAYTRSRDRYATTGGPNPQRRERPFREWLDHYFRREDQQELRRFRDRWDSLLDTYDLDEETHYF